MMLTDEMKLQLVDEIYEPSSMGIFMRSKRLGRNPRVSCDAYALNDIERILHEGFRSDIICTFENINSTELEKLESMCNEVLEL